MSQRTRRFVLAMLLVCSLFMFIGCASTSEGFIQESLVRTISVSGTGTVKVSPDIATFTVGISESAQTTAAAQQAVNAKMAQILSILKSNGVEPKDMTTTYLNLRPEYTWTDGKQQLVGQRASQQVAVTMRDMDKDVSKLAIVIDQLGAVTGLEFSSVQFDLQDKTQAYEQARELAVKKAMDKAGVYAKTADMVVGSPISISEQNDTSYIYPRNVAYGVSAKSMMAESAMDYSTELPSGELEITTTIYMVFEMN